MCKKFQKTGYGLSIDLSYRKVLVRYAYPGEPAPPSVQNTLLSVLAPEELSRWDRFRFNRDRWLYLVAHALLRFTLSSVSNVAPSQWTFRKKENAYPVIDMPTPAREFTFNLTHTRGLAACVVGRGLEVGIDAESIQDTVSDDFLERYFSPVENRSLKKIEGEERSILFYKLWTLKEAYLKAKGLGITVPLNHLSFVVSGNRATLTGCDSEKWRFVLPPRFKQHVLSVAVGQPPDESVRIEDAEIPLEHLFTECEKNNRGMKVF